MKMETVVGVHERDMIEKLVTNRALSCMKHIIYESSESELDEGKVILQALEDLKIPVNREGAIKLNKISFDLINKVIDDQIELIESYVQTYTTFETYTYTELKEMLNDLKALKENFNKKNIYNLLIIKDMNNTRYYLKSFATEEIVLTTNRSDALKYTNDENGRDLATGHANLIEGMVEYPGCINCTSFKDRCRAFEQCDCKYKIYQDDVCSSCTMIDVCCPMMDSSNNCENK